MSIAEKSFTEAFVKRSEWLDAVDNLFTEVEQWARKWLQDKKLSPAYGWDVIRREKEIQDDFVQDQYHMPMLEINNALPQDLQRGRGEMLVLEPMGFNPLSETGRIDFYAWPAMYRLRLLYKADTKQWIVKTDSGVNWPMPWNEDTFIDLAEGLLEA